MAAAMRINRATPEIMAQSGGWSTLTSERVVSEQEVSLRVERFTVSLSSTAITSCSMADVFSVAFRFSIVSALGEALASGDVESGG